MKASITADYIRQTAERIAGQVVRTPILHSDALSRLTGAKVFVKYENMQHAGCFKARGALAKIMTLTPAQAKAGIVTMSAGNHAQGVAFHAQRLGIPATIVMPKGTPFIKVRKTRDYGATVIQEGNSLSEAGIVAKDIAAKKGLTLVHPYDDDDVIAGQGSIALEMLADAPELDTLVIPIGGGGLIAGCAIAAKSVKPSIDIIGVETALYPSMINAVQGKKMPCGGVTLAGGIAVQDAGTRTTPIIRELVSTLLTVTETGIERGIALYASVCKTVAEGAGAAPLAAMLEHPERFRGRTVGLLLSGGNADARMLSSVLVRDLVRNRQILSLSIEIDDKPGQLHIISGICAAEGANILEISHTRSAMQLPASSALLTVTLETRDKDHAEKVKESLCAAGFASVTENANIH